MRNDLAPSVNALMRMKFGHNGRDTLGLNGNSMRQKNTDWTRNKNMNCIISEIKKSQPLHIDAHLFGPNVNAMMF